jgi:hypothetical protein
MAQQALDEEEKNAGSDPEISDDDEDEVLDSDDDMDEDRAFMSTRNNIRNRLTFLEFSQESLSRAQVMKRLLFCSLMLNITFVSWGLLQVRNYTLSTFVVLFHLKHITGTNVDSKIPSLPRRVLYILVCVGVHQSLLDSYHVRGAHDVSTSPSKSDYHPLRIQLSINQQYVEQLVSI